MCVRARRRRRIAGEAERRAAASGGRGTLGPRALRVQITLARYQGEKQISSAPNMLLMNADGQRAGSGWAQVPVPVRAWRTTARRRLSSPLYRHEHRLFGQANGRKPTVSVRAFD